MKNSKFDKFTKKTLFYSCQFLFLPISIITSLVLFPILIFLMHGEIIGFDSDEFLKIILLNQQKKKMRHNLNYYLNK